MASQLDFYNTFYALQWQGLNLATATVRVMLLTSEYTFDATHAHVAEVLGEGTSPEVPDGDGYTTGGLTLQNTSLTVLDTPRRTVFDADDPTWTALTATFRYAVFYLQGTVAEIVQPVLCCVLLDDTPADIVVTAVDYKLELNAAGLFTVKLAT